MVWCNSNKEIYWPNKTGVCPCYCNSSESAIKHVSSLSVR